MSVCVCEIERERERERERDAGCKDTVHSPYRGPETSRGAQHCLERCPGHLCAPVGQRDEAGQRVGVRGNGNGDWE